MAANHLAQYPRRDPPLPQLEKPDPVTWFDLSPEERATVKIETYCSTRRIVL